MSNLTFDDTNTQTSSYTSEKFLTFMLAEECYGVEVLKIREIIRMQKITPVPQMPEHVKGVINLRGKVIPVVDLRIKFNLPASEATERTCIIVVDVDGGQGVNQLLGLVVDAVEEVLSVTEDEVEPSPDFGTSLSTECCLGIARIKDSVKTLLDIEKVVSGELEGELSGF